MNMSAARTMPTSTAKVRSVTTVRVMVKSQTVMSAALSLRISGISCHSPMLYATIMRMAASAARGTFFTSGAANRTMASSVSAWIIPATGVLAPERTFVAVRAMAPVAGSPPKRGETMLATPWPINSTLGLCLSLLMRSETTADMSDSMAPSMATGKAAADAHEARSDRFDGYIQKRNGRGRTESNENCPGELFCIFQAENHHGDGKDGYKRRRDRNGVPRLPERFHPV